MKTMRSLRLVLATPLYLILLSLATGAEEKEIQNAKEVFEERILPIFKSEDPSSCVQCHLSGVDLKNYIRPTHEETFL